jgi:hypothetical protein
VAALTPVARAKQPMSRLKPRTPGAPSDDLVGGPGRGSGSRPSERHDSANLEITGK